MPVKINGLSETKASVDFGRVKDQVVREILNDAANRLIKLIRERAPKDTGVYSKSWKIKSQSQNNIVVSTDQKELAIMLEFGTSGGTISGEPLHFVVDGQDVFVRFVNSKGFAAIPHFKPSFERLKRELPQIASQKIRRNWNIFR